jgi:hypothetical protein
MLNVQASQLRSSLERSRIFCFVMLSLACLFLSSLAGASERCGSVDRIKIAFRLTEAIYPETNNREFDVSLGNGYSGPPSCPTDARAVMITVAKDSRLLFGKPDPKTEEYFSEQGLDLPFHLRFDFIPNSPPTLRCLPDFLNDHPSDERQKTEEVMQSHPDWTAEEALAAARKAGLRFGPSDEGKLLRQLPLKELGEIYGPLRIQRVEFALMQEHEKDAAWWFTELEWDISAKLLGTNKTLQMTVDPFTGRIFALHFFAR